MPLRQSRRYIDVALCNFNNLHVHDVSNFVFPETSGCYVVGDPHVLTYDGEHLYIQSDCLYTLVENVDPTTMLPPFIVNTKFEHRNGITKISWPEYIQLIVYDTDIIIDRDRIVTVNII